MPLLPTDKANAEKKLLRVELRKRRAALDDEYRKSSDRKLIDALFSLPQFKNAKTVLTFYPVGSEPSVLEIAEKSLSLGKQVAFPLCHPEGPYMTFHLVKSITDLTVGSYGIPEPDEAFSRSRAQSLGGRLCHLSFAPSFKGHRPDAYQQRERIFQRGNSPDDDIPSPGRDMVPLQR